MTAISGGCEQSDVGLGGPDLAAGGVDLASGGCLTQCAGKCVDLQTDEAHCGACNLACAGNQVCQAGKCVAAGCMSASECADMHKCTLDTCEQGVCKHVPGPNAGPTGCPAGQLCDATKGCVPVMQPAPGMLCKAAPPQGATLAAAPPAYSGGTCPKLVAGTNMIASGGATRSFMLAVPANLDPKESLPVVFLWHWLGGSAKSFYTKGEIQAAVDTQRFVAVLPEAKGDLQFKWPYAVIDSQSRMNEEFKFFDDMLACVAAQFNVNKECVASAGVSAGALFTDQLVGVRSQYLASGLSLSGGVGGNFIKPWTKPARKLPMLVLWGGPSDTCFSLMNFDMTSKNLESALDGDGHFYLECVHNCGHAEPPLDAPMGLSRYAALWQFVFDHPYWLKPGESTYQKTGIPATFPSWCGIGKASATPRAGACPDPPGC